MWAVTASASDPPRLFVRKTSGLIRTIGIWGAVVIGVHCISLSSSGILTFCLVPGLWPGADYTLASRTLSPRLAFPVNSALVLSKGLVAGGLVASIATVALPA